MPVIIHEPFLTDLSAFDSTVLNAGKYGWVSLGYDGVHPGIEMVISNTNPMWGMFTLPAITSETDVRFRGGLNLSTIAGSSGSFLELFIWRTSGGTQRLKLTLYKNGSTMSLVHDLRGDDGAVHQEIVSLGGATILAWELWVNKTAGESKLYWDTGGSGLVLKSTRTKVITNTFDDQTQAYYGTLGNPNASVTGKILLGPFGYSTGSSAIGPYSYSAPPVLDPGADQVGTFGTPKFVTTVDFTDSGNNVDECNLSCNSGGTITVVPNGAAIVTGNGTNSVNITGTHAEVLATIDDTNGIRFDRDPVPWVDAGNPPPLGHLSFEDVILIEIIDEDSLTDSGTFNLVWSLPTGDGTTSLLLDNASIAGLNAEIAVSRYIPIPGSTYNSAIHLKLTDDNDNTAELLVPIIVGEGENLLDRSAWTVWVDDEELAVGDFDRLNAIDGNPSSFWHTGWYGGDVPPYPHSFVVDLHTLNDIGGFKMLSRMDSPNGRIGAYEFYTHSDTSTPPAMPPIAGNWSLKASGTFPNDGTEKEVTFTPVNCRYVWLKALNEAQGQGYLWANIAEFNLIGVETGQTNLPPTCTIDFPSGPESISVGGSVTFVGTAIDPDENYPLSHLWEFGVGSGIPPSVSPSPGAVIFPNPGIFLVTYTVTDVLGGVVEVPASVWITVLTVPNLPPMGRIVSPVGPQTIVQGQSVSFIGDGVDPDNHLPLTYRWSFSPGVGVNDILSQNTGPVFFQNSGVFTVTLTVRDSLGVVDINPKTVQIAVLSNNDGSGVPPVNVLPTVNVQNVRVSIQPAPASSEKTVTGLAQLSAPTPEDLIQLAAGGIQILTLQGWSSGITRNSEAGGYIITIGLRKFTTVRILKQTNSLSRIAIRQVTG